MAISIVRLGTRRSPGEGPRLGTVRRPPRGVRRQDYARRDFYDVWLPELAPSAAIVRWALSQPWTDARWKQFTKKYRAEMGKAPALHILQTLAALSATSDFSVGCYCEEESRCHRALLRQILIEQGATLK